MTARKRTPTVGERRQAQADADALVSKDFAQQRRVERNVYALRAR